VEWDIDTADVDWNVVGGITIMVVCAVAMIILVVDDATGVGFTDDLLIAPIGEAFVLGFKMATGASF